MSKRQKKARLDDVPGTATTPPILYDVRATSTASNYGMEAVAFLEGHGCGAVELTWVKSRAVRPHTP